MPGYPPRHVCAAVRRFFYLLPYLRPHSKPHTTPSPESSAPPATPSSTDAPTAGSGQLDKVSDLLQRGAEAQHRGGTRSTTGTVAPQGWYMPVHRDPSDTTAGVAVFRVRSGWSVPCVSIPTDPFSNRVNAREWESQSGVWQSASVPGVSALRPHRTKSLRDESVE